MFTKKIYLPIFEWFYNTLNSFDDEYFIENFKDDLKNNEIDNISFNIKEINDYWYITDLFDSYYKTNYEKYNIDYSKEYVNSFNELYKKDLELIWFYNITFDKLESPQYYNYWKMW